LERVDQWKFDHDPIVFISDTFISKNNTIIGYFRDENIAEVTPKGIKQVIGIGEGPDQVIFPCLIFRYGDGDDIAVSDLANRIKIFYRKDRGFTSKKSFWYKVDSFALVARECVFSDNKFFITGTNIISQNKIGSKVALITIFNEKGKQLKVLLEKKLSAQQRYDLMYYHIINLKKGLLAFIPENEPTVTLISPKSMEVVKQVPLTIPSFYKKMPGDFYTIKKKIKPGDSGAFILQMLETFRTGYSRINNLNFDQNWLILQMRTCDKKLKRYAILVYNADTFKLEHTLYTDDYLVGVKDGKFYCFANGNPGWDGEIDDVVFNIYQLKK